MEKKVVLITGGSSGIGLAIGKYLLNKNFRVYGTSRNPDRLPDFKDFTLLPLDVTKPESAKDVLTHLMQLEGKIDVLINNAGIGITGAIEETPNEEMEQAFQTNFYGPINMMKAVLPIMRNQQSGYIINVTSIAGYMGSPYRGVYSATKGALQLITEAVRIETKKFGVKICTLAPGDFATNIAQGRYHTPVLKGSPYQKEYQQILHSIDRDVDAGGDPIAVGKIVYKILKTKKPKPHYSVGAFMQRFSIVLKRLLPNKVYEKLLTKHYKL
ncbi:MAG: SDR family oxidoreductase [Flavobacteriaceae bacterium]|nr:SDR family oxidoreductase [Flavobacteriaceae bacterium]